MGKRGRVVVGIVGRELLFALDYLFYFGFKYFSFEFLCYFEVYIEDSGLYCA